MARTNKPRHVQSLDRFRQESTSSPCLCICFQVIHGIVGARISSKPFKCLLHGHHPRKTRPERYHDLEKPCFRVMLLHTPERIPPETSPSNNLISFFGRELLGSPPRLGRRTGSLATTEGVYMPKGAAKVVLTKHAGTSRMIMKR